MEPRTDRCRRNACFASCVSRSSPAPASGYASLWQCWLQIYAPASEGLATQAILLTSVFIFILERRGAAFIAVFYTKVQDLWSKSEDLWEGMFGL